MPWNSYNASFRNIPFEVVSFSDDEIGRVLVTKRIAGSDSYAVEDVSLLQNRFSIEGLLLGSNAQQQWASLKRAFEIKGSGDFQHNYYTGRIKVHVESSSLIADEPLEDTIKFRVAFVKAGLPIFEQARPSAIQDFSGVSSRLRLSSNRILQSRLLTNGVSGFARSGTANSVSGFNQFLGGILSSARFAENLVAGTGNIGYANNLTSLKGILGAVPIVNNATQIFSSLTTTLSYMSQLSTNNKNYVTEIKPFLKKKKKKINTNTDDGSNYNENVIAIDNAIKILIVAEIADAIPELTFESYDEAIAFKDETIADIAVLTLAEEELDYQTVLEISDMINKVAFHIPIVAEDLPNLGTIENVRNRNLADILYSNSITKDDIESVLKRNSITNPMRIDKDSITVLI